MIKNLLIAVVGLVVIGFIFTFVVPALPQQEPDIIGCTMEAKLCPDGSAVGRQGPNCEFTACPGE